MMVPTTRTCRWLVCETGDRWYRGVCRYAPGVVSNETVLRIERISGEKSNSILSRLKAANDRVVVLWELPEFQVEQGQPGELADFLFRLDLISAIRLESRSVTQVAWLSPAAPTEAFLSAQEAGISFFLQGLGALPRVVHAVSKHFSPLG